MRVCFGMPSLASYKTTLNMAAGAPLYATFAPYFGFGLDDNDPVGVISTTPTGWSMHGSNQNDCHHVRVEGRCYKLDVPSYYNRPYDVQPVYRFSNGSKVVEGNYMFSFKTGINTVYTAHKDNIVQTYVVFDVWQPLVDFGLPEGYYAFWTYPSTIIEDLSTGQKQYNAWGKSHYASLTCTIYYCKDGRCNSNFIGRTYGYFYARFDSNGNPVMSYNITSVNRRSWSNMISTAEQEFRVERPEVLDRFHDNPDKMFFLDYDWDAAMVPALNQVNFFDSNGIAFAKDVASLPMTIMKDLDNLKQFAKVTKSGKLKIAASIFLSVHFGYKLLAADGIELVNELLKYQTECTNHLGQTVSATVGLSEKGPFRLADANGHLNVYYNPYSRLCTDIGRFAEAVDLIPDFSNIWDMIPFSFVVDWFTNIGDLASGIDNFFTLTQQSEVLGSILSKKVSYTYQPEGFDGNLMIHHYFRTCRPGWYPIPRFSFQLKNPVTNLYHWFESSALVVSKVM